MRCSPTRARTEVPEPAQRRFQPTHVPTALAPIFSWQEVRDHCLPRHRGRLLARHSPLAVAIPLDVALVEGAAAAEGAVRGSIPGPPPRALEFDALKHKLLESELKALYCAVTRARVNIWFVDFDEEARKPAYTWFADAGLANVKTQGADGGLEDAGDGGSSGAGFASSQNSTPEQWLERGESATRL